MMSTSIAAQAMAVPAEPVNARLLDVATGKIPHLYAGLCPDIDASPRSRDPECPACQVISAAESAPKAAEMMERLAQQQAGTHPAPCARSCEANAYQIEVRRYQAEVEQFRADARRFRIAEKNLFDVQEAAKIIAKQAIAAEAERDALAAELKALREQEPVAFMHDQETRRDCVHIEVLDFLQRANSHYGCVNKIQRIPLDTTEHYTIPLYARPVPAEPVNARLMEALRDCVLVMDHDLNGMAVIQPELRKARAAIATAEAQQSDALEQVRAEEREACAKACMDEARKWPYPSHGNAAASMCAKMIFDMRQK